jgi:hypothetical protein
MIVLWFVGLLLVLSSGGKIDFTEYGTHIHYSSKVDKPGQFEELSLGFRIARSDFTWAVVESTKGQYNFSEYDRLYSELSTAVHRVRCYFIFCYGNPLYDGGNPPTSPDAIQAFVNFAVAGITHFKDKGIIWEMWNEPNGDFWKPAPNATQYSILAYAVGKAIRGTPDIANEIYVGPATSDIDLKFIEAVLKYGLLDVFDAVSVHPYRAGGPESVIPEYANLTTLIKQYASGKSIPIFSGEWGWSTCTPPCSPHYPQILPESLQASYLVRQWFVNALSSIPISIFYDFVDDGPDPTVREDNFGTCSYGYHNSSLPFKHKPAFDAAVVFHSYLDNYSFQQRIDSNPVDQDTFILAWGNHSHPGSIYSIWKTSGTPIEDCNAVIYPIDCGYNGIDEGKCLNRGCCWKIPAPTNDTECFFHAQNTKGTVEFKPLTSGCFKVNDIYNAPILPKICSNSQGTLSLTVSDDPQYIIPL